MFFSEYSFYEELRVFINKINKFSNIINIIYNNIRNDSPTFYTQFKPTDKNDMKSCISMPT